MGCALFGNGRSRHRAPIAAGITGEVEPERCLARLMPEVARKLGAFAATPVFIIPDEIVPGAVNVKDFPNLIKAARKKNARGRDGQAAGWSSR